jgi:hypothetical protein
VNPWDGHPHEPAIYPYCRHCYCTWPACATLASNRHGSGWLSAHSWLRYQDADYAPDVEELRRVMSIGVERE